MPALSTWCRREGESPAAFVGRASAAGATGIMLEGTLDEVFLDELMPEILVSGLATVAVETPLTRPRAAGSRAPWLASEDKEERRAALAAAELALARGRELGARVLVARLGELPVRHDFRALVRAFARRELDRDRVERIIADRVQMAHRALDLCRYGLEPLLSLADAAGVTVALANRARWYELPDVPERDALLADFAGAPLATWHDTAAAHARTELGFGDTPVGPAAGAWLGDACGTRGGLPWGFGEATPPKLPDGALRVIHCAPIATDDELARALSAS